MRKQNFDLRLQLSVSAVRGFYLPAPFTYTQHFVILLFSWCWSHFYSDFSLFITIRCLLFKWTDCFIHRVRVHIFCMMRCHLNAVMKYMKQSTDFVCHSWSSALRGNKKTTPRDKWEAITVWVSLTLLRSQVSSTFTMSQQGSVCVCVYMMVVVSNVPHFISAVTLDWERQEVKLNQANSWQTSCVLRHSLLCFMKKVKWGIVGELSRGKHCLVVGFSVFACVCYASCSFLIKKKKCFLANTKETWAHGFHYSSHF